MKKSVRAVFAGLLIAGTAMVFTSCESEIRIRANANGVDFTYKVNSGSGFKDLLSMMGDEESSAFDPEETKNMFTEAGFSNISVKAAENFNLEVKGELPETADDPISKSGMLSFSVDGKFVNLKFTQEILNNFYESSSEQIQNMIDMLMAPTFTGEEMTDSEYLDLLASVYGQKLADELATAKIRVVLESPSGKTSKHTIGLVTLLNLMGKIEFSA